MSTISTKPETIQNDKTKFRTQIVDGKPQIFFENLDELDKKTRPKRNSRMINHSQSLRQNEQPKLRPGQQKTGNDQRPPPGNSRIAQNNDGRQKKDDTNSMGVYMTMDELSELVQAVKENAKKEIQPNTTIKERIQPPAPPPPPDPVQPPTQYQEQPPPVVSKLDLQQNGLTAPPGHISPRDQALSIMAEKKRQKWQRERAEVERLQMEIQYDQLKHQLSPRHNKNSVSPERSTFQYDFPTNGKPPPAPTFQTTVRPNDSNVETTSRMDGDVNNFEQAKTRLIEKKQQQWRQEKDKMNDWNPFGRPGGGAPNPTDMTSRQTPAPSTINQPYRQPPPPPTAMTATKIEQTPFPPTANYVHNDQLRVPAAMRTNLVFGDSRPEDDVKLAKEVERRQWLEDLQKQIEENKRKKSSTYENDRRKDFLHENVQPLLQEAANRHNSNARPTGNHSNGHDYISNQDGRSTVAPENQRSGEKLFGPNYETAPKGNSNNHLDLLQMNGNFDAKHQYRMKDTRRDEAVNTVVTTFRSDQTNSNDYRTSPSKQAHNGYAYEDTDLPPYASNARHMKGKRNGRMRSNDENGQGRRTSGTTQQSNFHYDGTTYQLNGQRQIPIKERPLWNYKNPANREYLPNSKRDPHYERRQRLKHFEEGNFDRIDDVQKKVCYNRWNSDSELQQNSKKNQSKSRIRSTNSKMTGAGGNRKDENIFNLLKGHQRHQEINGLRKPSSIPVRTDDDYQSNRASSPDRDENLSIYQQGDDRQESSPRSQSRNSSPHKMTIDTRPYDEVQEQNWQNQSRTEPPPPPISRQEHILQQLTTIRENLVRRQRELAT